MANDGMVLHAGKCKPGGLCVSVRAVCRVSRTLDGEVRSPVSGPVSVQGCQADARPFCLLMQVELSQLPAIVPPGPARALLRTSHALAWATQTFCDSTSTCRMNSIPMSHSGALYMQPWIEPGIWFHELPLLAMISGAIIATDIGTTPVGMIMVLTHESTIGKYSMSHLCPPPPRALFGTPVFVILPALNPYPTKHARLYIGFIPRIHILGRPACAVATSVHVKNLKHEPREEPKGPKLWFKRGHLGGLGIGDLPGGRGHDPAALHLPATAYTGWCPTPSPP